MAVLTIAGRIGSDGATRLAEELNRRIDAGATRVVLDLTGVDYLNSAGLQVLETAATQLEARGGGLGLSGLREPVRLVLEMAGLKGLMTGQLPTANSQFPTPK